MNETCVVRFIGFFIAKQVNTVSFQIRSPVMTCNLTCKLCIHNKTICVERIYAICMSTCIRVEFGNNDLFVMILITEE